MKNRPAPVVRLVAAALLAAVPALAAAQGSVAAGLATAPGAAMAVETLKATATVVGIDAGTRVVTLKRQDGKVVNITAGEQVRNFDQIRVGDRVNVEYLRALSLDLKKGGGGVREKREQDLAARAPLGAKPAGAVGKQVTILADVVAVDAKQKTVTLKGPQGNQVDLKVEDPEQLKNIKKGDQVEAIYTEAVAVSVEAAPAAAPKK